MTFIRGGASCHVGMLRTLRLLRSGAKRKQQVMARTNPFEFIQQVRAEVSKVVWPTRKETMITTIMVLIMVFLASLFFLAVDQILSWGVQFLLQLGR